MGNLYRLKTTKTFGCSIKWASKIEWRTKLDAEWKNKPVEVIEADFRSIKGGYSANKSDKYRLINVWATWCGPCVIEFPEFVICRGCTEHAILNSFPSALTE